MYRTPSSNEENINLISKELDTMCGKYKTYNTCISGDFNLPTINWHIPSLTNNDVITTSKFVSCVIDNGLSQVVDFKTRGSKTLDLILFHNFSCLIDAKVIEPLVNSDHESI